MMRSERRHEAFGCPRGALVVADRLLPDLGIVALEPVGKILQQIAIKQTKVCRCAGRQSVFETKVTVWHFLVTHFSGDARSQACEKRRVRIFLIPLPWNRSAS